MTILLPLSISAETVTTAQFGAQPALQIVDAGGAPLQTSAIGDDCEYATETLQLVVDAVNAHYPALTPSRLALAETDTQNDYETIAALSAENNRVSAENRQLRILIAWLCELHDQHSGNVWLPEIEAGLMAKCRAIAGGVA